MKRTARIVIAIAIMATAALGTTQAGATECTPKGCSGGCKLQLSLERPLNCTS